MATQIFCGKCYDTVSKYIELDCGHEFCYQCIDPGDQYFQCFKCKENRRRYVEKLNIITKEDFSKCIVCQEIIEILEFPFSCGHPFCESCLSNFWVSQMKEGYMRTLKQFDCPHCKKSSPLSEERIQKLLPVNLFILIKDRETSKELYICPNCDYVFTHQKDTNYQCPSCKNEICPYCRQIHGEDKKCFNNDFQQIFLKLLKEDVRYCPHCDDPYMKDRQCDHVTCFNCRRQFCYFCMVDYNPIRQHGASRHRTDCRNFGGNNHHVEECAMCDNCQPPTENMEQFVLRKNYYVNPNYKNFNSAPGWAEEEEDIDLGFFD